MCLKCKFTPKNARKVRCKKSKGKRMRIYFCSDCNAWHLTKNLSAQYTPQNHKFFGSTLKPNNMFITEEELIELAEQLRK